MKDSSGAVARALQLARALRASHARPLVIAIINNMPDAALAATENHYCQLLADASEGMLVELKFYSLPEIQRGPAEQARIARYYEPFATLGQNPPDGLIVTGAEPRAPRLTDEIFWPSFSRLVDWSDAAGIPAVWSCLAAHAAVYHTDGIERHRFATKLSGVFECKFVRRHYQIVHGLPPRWRVPHSRLHGLRTRDLEAHGYTILSQSRQTGADLFMRETGALHLFLQGHPEYDPATLLLEYRRDLLRTQRRQLPNPPAPPQGIWHLPQRDHEFRRLAKAGESPKLISRLDSLLEHAPPHKQWGRAAQILYTNWLAYLQSRQNAPAAMFEPPERNDAPAAPYAIPETAQIWPEYTG